MSRMVFNKETIAVSYIYLYRDEVSNVMMMMMMMMKLMLMLMKLMLMLMLMLMCYLTSPANGRHIKVTETHETKSD